MYELIVLICTISSAYSSIVTTGQGILNGTHLQARHGKLFNAFYAIPYAQPPIGKLRFKPPIEARSWNGIRDATKPPPICIQLIDGTNQTRGTEDCLYLNVYSPLGAQQGQNLPVLVYLFGGKFKIGWSTQNGPQRIMQRDVIVVMPSYRLGVLGFLSTGDALIPGNFGLKDQVLALKWVQKNIRYFGGDPTKVTLHGHSAGSISAHLHTLSPSSKGLFHKVILQSGVGYSPAAYFGPDITRAISKEFAIKAGCPSTVSSRMYQCFMNMDPVTTVLAAEQMYVWDKEPEAIFTPTVEPSTSDQAFLTEFPQKLKYHSPELPMIIGTTTGEAAFKTARYLQNNATLASIIDQNYELLLPITLEYLWNTKHKYLNHISRVIRARYFGKYKMNETTANNMTAMYTECFWSVCANDVMHSYPGPKYVYLYDYVANYTEQNTIGYYDGFLGVSHADDIELIFHREESFDSLTQQDYLFADELIKRWINFVDTSNPNFPNNINTSMMSSWEPMSSRRIEYLYINLNGTMRTDLYNETYEFWKSLPLGNKYY